MKLTPLDVKKQEFNKAIRGYDPVEVDAFLEMVSDELESLIREKNHLSDEILKLKTQLQDYQNVEKTLKETLMHAQQSLNESKANSTRQAELILREAELKAEKIMEDTKIKMAAMKNDLILVKTQKDSFARRLRHLLESQIELIEVLELDDLGFEKLAGKRTQRQASPKPQQEKIEFEGVDEVLPDDSVPEEDSKEEISEPSELPWGRKQSGNRNEEEMDENDDDKKSPLSDELII